MSVEQGQSIDIKVPVVGESISEVFIGEWYVVEGQYVNADDSLVGLETDKATFDVPAPTGGTVTKVIKPVGVTASIGEVIATFAPSDAPKGKSRSDAPQGPSVSSDSSSSSSSMKPKSTDDVDSNPVMPAAERLMKEHNISSVTGSGPGGRVLKEDVQQRIDSKLKPKTMTGSRETRMVPLSPIRQTIARRLVEVQQTAALLTTFNEIDMTVVKSLRTTYRDAFEKKHGRKLGFMPFFVKAVVVALEEFPQVNAQMRDDKLVYHNYCDVGIAIGGGKGLVVPMLRNAEQMSFADIEHAIADFAARATKNQIVLEELEGGTFTITNGGVYGSLLSTPIVNPPQSGVLGMHGIVDRPIAVDGQVVIRPMMYVALTYDHRVVDGREAVTFLRRIKEQIEDPARIVIEV